METNGDVIQPAKPKRPTGPPKSLRKLRESLERRVLEGLWYDLWDDFGGSDMLDRVRDRDGEAGWVPLSVASDRRRGSEWPLWRSEMDLDRLRNQSRLCVSAANSYGKCLLKNLTNSVISKGFAYKVQSKEKKLSNPDQPGQDGVAERLVNMTQDVVDEFCQLNRWNAVADPREDNNPNGTREKESYRRVHRDGEAFIRFFYLDDGPNAGKTRVRFVEPEQIRNPPGSLDSQGWTYGCQHRVDDTGEDVEDIVAYHAVYQAPDIKGRKNTANGEIIPAREMIHIKNVDTDAAVKRGLPTFIWDTLDALNRASKLQRNISVSSAVRAATAEIWEYAVATNAQVTGLAMGLAERQRIDPISGKTENIERIKPGTIRRGTAGQKMVPPPVSYGTTDHLAAAQGDLRQASAAVCAPEYFTGDASNANYSCHDVATELLTLRGWLKWDQIEYGDQAGTMNPLTGRFEWQPIKAINIHDYSGEMVRLKGRHNLDVLVTPNHRMYAAKMQNRRHGGRSGKMTREGQKPFEFIRADELRPGNILPFACLPKDGVMQESVTLPSVLNKRWAEYGREQCLPMQPFLSFLGWWISEGHVSVYQRRYMVGVAQSQKNEEECQSIQEAVSRLPELRLKNYKPSNGMSVWLGCNKSLGTWLINNCGKGSYQKHLPGFVNDLPAIQQEIILKSLNDGDGHDRESGAKTYFSVSRQLADQVQSLAIQCGYVSHLGKQMNNGVWPVTIRPAKRFLRVSNRHISRVPYTGKVWCVTVDNGLIVTRRHGKSLIAGNSSKESGTPYIRAAESEQEHFKGAFTACVWRAVKWAVQCGRLPGEVMTMVDIQVEAPQVTTTDPLLETQCNQIKNQAGVISVQTWQQQEGLDPEIEAANIQEHNDRFGAPGGALPMPDDGQGDPFGGQQPGQQPQPPKLAAMEGFDESKVKRGQPDNAGQFGPGGGGVKKKDKPAKSADSPSGEAAGDVHADASHALAKPSLVARMKALPGAVAHKAKQVVSGIYAKAEEKYGPKWAKAIVATAIITAPTPITLLSVAAMTGLAHVYTHYVGGKVHESDEGTMTKEEIEAAAKAMMEEIRKALGE